MIPFRLWQICGVGAPLLFAGIFAGIFFAPHPIAAAVGSVCFLLLAALGSVGAYLGLKSIRGPVLMRCPFCHQGARSGYSKEDGAYLLCDRCGFVHGAGLMRTRLVCQPVPRDEDDEPDQPAAPKAGPALRPSAAPTSDRSRWTPVALGVTVIGAIFALGSSIHVYNGWRIALNREHYRPVSAKLLEVRYWKHRNGSSCVASGLIEGVREDISLKGFGPWYTSQAEWDRHFPVGSSIEVWYDPTAPEVMMQGIYLRVLPRSYPMADALGVALKRTALFDSALLIGVVLFLYLEKGSPPDPSVELARIVSRSRSRRNRAASRRGPSSTPDKP